MRAKPYEGIVEVNPHHARSLMVEGQSVATDSEGYLLDRRQWSRAFAEALAAEHGVTLTDDHWTIITFIRNHWRTRGRVASLRQMARHFTTVWGSERGSAGALFRLFEAGGGPEKFGNRLAGVPRPAGDS